MKKMIFICLFSLVACVKEKNIVQSEVVDGKGEKLHLIFNNDSSELSVEFQGKKHLLKQVPMASGIRYEGNGYHFSEWHGETEFGKDEEILFRSP